MTRLTLRVFLYILVFSSACSNTGIALAKDNHPGGVRLDQKDSEALDLYSWDFGRAEEGTVLKHAFIIKNDSSGNLRINQVNTSCGCTVSEVKKKVLRPKEETVLEVAFNTKGYQGPTQQYIYVHTDNLDNPVIRYIIKADIIKR